jgi:choline dehydrogenase-like flavoprotein
VSACRLTEKGYDVVVLEQGRRWTPENLPSTNWKVWDYLWRPGLRLRGFLNLALLKHVLILHGNAVGGGSITYARRCWCRPTRSGRTGWAGLDDWGSVMPEHYRTAKRMLGVTQNRRPDAATGSCARWRARPESRILLPDRRRGLLRRGRRRAGQGVSPPALESTADQLVEGLRVAGGAAEGHGAASLNETCLPEGSAGSEGSPSRRLHPYSILFNLEIFGSVPAHGTLASAGSFA